MEKSYINLAIPNLPNSYNFEISNTEISFEKYKQFEDNENDLAWAFAIILWRKRNDILPNTAIAQLFAIDRFFEYLNNEIGSLRLDELNQEVVNNFIYWLKFNSKLRLDSSKEISESSKRRVWGYVRSYLSDLMKFEMIQIDLDLPIQIFDSNQGETFKPYSNDELKNISQACVKDTKALLHKKRITSGKGRFPPVIANLIPHAILISIRTGLNPEVLFDMDIPSISIKKSYILNSSRLILPLKRRSGKSHNMDLIDEFDEGLRVKNNIVRLIEEVEELTKGVRDRLPLNSQLKNKLWLVENENNQIVLFNDLTYYESLQSFAKRHNIVNELGEVTKINFRRFRPTFAEGILKVNGGDVRDLQKRLGHSHLRTTMGYLDPNLEERKQSFQFAGKAMVEWALKGNEKPSKENVAEILGITLDSAQKFANGDFNMGVGKCKDPFDSPLKGIKKGDLCTEYLACFRCGNCVVMKEDGQRLFSFYHWLKSKKEIIGHEKWQLTYGWIIEIIDNDIAPQLGNDEWIDSSKIEAKENPFPMWKIEVQN